MASILPSSLPPSPQFTIETDDLDLVGDIIQSLASYLGLTGLSVTASFPQQMKELRDVLEKVVNRGERERGEREERKRRERGRKEREGRGGGKREKEEGEREKRGERNERREERGRKREDGTV